MKPSHRRLLLFVVVDALVLAAFATWWFNRPARNPIQPATPPPAAVTQAPPATQAQGPLPQALSGAVECHGTWAGQPFWLRLSAPDPAFGGNRHLRLLYTPPAQAEVEGAAIHDSPLLLVDEHLRIVQWDNRDGATGVMVTDTGYRVTRELHANDETTALKTRTIKQVLAWDLRIAPLLAVLTTEGPAWSVPAVDFWGARATERLTATGDGATLTVGGIACTVSRGDGRVTGLLDAQGQPVVTVTAWK